MHLYLMFADTDAGELTSIIDASDDIDAIRKMEKIAKERAKDIYAIAGVWEKDKLFYTAQSIHDLEPEEW